MTILQTRINSYEALKKIKLGRFQIQNKPQRRKNNIVISYTTGSHLIWFGWAILWKYSKPVYIYLPFWLLPHLFLFIRPEITVLAAWYILLYVYTNRNWFIGRIPTYTIHLFVHPKMFQLAGDGVAPAFSLQHPCGRSIILLLFVGIRTY